MTQKELEFILTAGEGYNIEFKESISSNIPEEICAFANAAGGTIIIGIKDDNTIRGVEINNTTRSSLIHSLNVIDPKIDVTYEEIEHSGKKLISLSCETGKKKPYTVSGAIFIRIGPNKQKITSVEQMRDFFQQSERIYFDEIACELLDSVSDFDSDSFIEFLAKAEVSNNLDQKTLQENLKLIDGSGKLKNGAALFFAKRPQAIFEQAMVRCVQYKGMDKRFPIDKKDMLGNLLQQYDQAIKYILSKLNLRYEIESQGINPRKEILEIPEIVFKEVLVNALAHRDYYDKGACIMVELYDDRIEITNPGGLVNSIPKSEFGKRSLSRNPLIFGLFARTKMVEQIGSGISRIRASLNEAGLMEPEFHYDGIFSVTLFRPVNFDKWIVDNKDQLSGTRIQILKLINDNPTISKSALAKVVGISTTAIDRHISVLRESGLITRIGADRGGSWKLILKKIG